MQFKFKKYCLIVINKLSVEIETFCTESKWIGAVLSDLVVRILDSYQDSVFYCIKFFMVLFYFYRECITTRSTPQHTSEFRSRNPPYITNLQSRE